MKAQNSCGKANSIKPESVATNPLTKEQIVETYKDCFEGLGTFPGEPYKFRLKPNAVPAKHGIRKVPLHLKESFHKEIHDLVDQGVLEPVTESTEWVNSYVIVEKEASIDSSSTHAPNHTIKKKLRICLDPRDLNEALEREPYYSRSVDELIAKFQDAVVFSIVDMKKGYWMVVLHPDSRKLTCMALDIGRFQWTRLPMGTVVAADIFQKKLDSIFAGEPGITGIADDMVIYGSSTMEHDRNFLRFMELCRKNNLKLNKDKLQLRKETVSFFGHLWSKDGIRADPKKIAAITSMEFPPDKETCRSFLGMVNYLNRYSPRLAELTASLRDMCPPEKTYNVKNKDAIRDFHLIQQEVGKGIILPYFDMRKHTVLQTDASTKGLGAVLMQDGIPVYFASRALTKTEKNSYQNLEREALGTIFEMEKFHYFL
ncbi:MAG: RNA-directed DNA polymerase, partial [Candidatus Omnitrophica bacterium]|nr:RNA-directed DNA polymerase [Candidatus Omnitrophota bacterium]